MINSTLHLRRSTQVTFTTKGLLFTGPQQRLTMSGGESVHSLWRVLEPQLRGPGLGLDQLNALPKAAAEAASTILDELSERRLIVDGSPAATMAPSEALAEYITDVADHPTNAGIALRDTTVQLAGTDEFVEIAFHRIRSLELQAVRAAHTAVKTEVDVEYLDISWTVGADKSECRMRATAWPAFGLVSPVGNGSQPVDSLQRVVTGIGSEAFRDVAYTYPPGLLLEVLACLVTQGVVNTLIGATDYSDDQVRLVESTRLTVRPHPPKLDIELPSIRPRSPRDINIEELLRECTDELSGVIAAPSPYPITQGAASAVAAVKRLPWTFDYDAVLESPEVVRIHLGPTLEDAWNDAALADLAELLPHRPCRAWSLDRSEALTDEELDQRTWYRIAAPDLETLIAKAVANCLFDVDVDVAGRSFERTIGETPAQTSRIEVMLDSEYAATAYEWKNGCRLIGNDGEQVFGIASMITDEMLDAEGVGATTALVDNPSYWRNLGRHLGLDAWAQHGEPAMRQGGIALGWIGFRHACLLGGASD